MTGGIFTANEAVGKRSPPMRALRLRHEHLARVGVVNGDVSTVHLEDFPWHIDELVPGAATMVESLLDKITCRRGGPYVFKIRGGFHVLRMMARPCRELAEAHGAQLATERLLRDRNPKLFKDPLR